MINVYIAPVNDLIPFTVDLQIDRAPKCFQFLFRFFFHHFSLLPGWLFTLNSMLALHVPPFRVSLLCHASLARSLFFCSSLPLTINNRFSSSRKHKKYPDFTQKSICYSWKLNTRGRWLKKIVWGFRFDGDLRRSQALVFLVLFVWGFRRSREIFSKKSTGRESEKEDWNSIPPPACLPSTIIRVFSSFMVHHGCTLSPLQLQRAFCEMLMEAFLP